MFGGCRVHVVESITMKSFRSYREARLPLAPLTVLIGANASGKSNAIDAHNQRIDVTCLVEELWVETR